MAFMYKNLMKSSVESSCIWSFHVQFLSMISAAAHGIVSIHLNINGQLNLLWLHSIVGYSDAPVMRCSTPDEALIFLGLQAIA